MMKKRTSLAFAAALLMLPGAALLGADAAPAPAPVARLTRELALAREELGRGKEHKAYVRLLAAMPESRAAPLSQRLDLAESLVELRDYRRAGNLILGLFEERSLAPAASWRPSAEERRRALLLLGKLLFFLDRAPIDQAGRTETTAKRLEALEWAASAVREVARGDDARATEALYYLAKIQESLGHDEEAAATLDEFLKREPPEALRGEMRFAAECRHQQVLDSREDGTEDTAGHGTVWAPVKQHDPAPRYTEPARQAGIEGNVILVGIVDQSGKFVCVRPVRALPQGLTEAAIETVSRWRFRPAHLNGKPVSVSYNLAIRFQLRGH